MKKKRFFSFFSYIIIKKIVKITILTLNNYDFNEDWYIFGGINPLSTTTIGRKKDIYCKKANVKKIRIHDFRHSHASLLLSYGVPITVISQRLGHSDTNMTLNIYSHLIPQDEDKAIDILNNLNSNN